LSSKKTLIVTEVRRDRQAVLAQYLAPDGSLERRIIPSEALAADGEVAAQDWQLGIPFGLPWEDLIVFKATPLDFANNLHRQGIWTADDLSRNPNAAFAAWQETYQLDIAGLLHLAKIASSGAPAGVSETQNS
jgi:hypothetical protein